MTEARGGAALKLLQSNDVKLRETSDCGDNRGKRGPVVKDVTIIEGQPRRRGRYSRAAAAEAHENQRVNQKKKGEQSEDRKTPHIDIQGSDVGRKRVGRALPPPNSPPPHVRT